MIKHTNLCLLDVPCMHEELTCHHSPFKYSPTSLPEDLNKIDNENLRKINVKGPKYHDPQSINWKYNFKLMMDYVEDYASKWTKRGKEEVETFSDWVKAIWLFIQIRIGANTDICPEGKKPTLTSSYYWTCKNEHTTTKNVINERTYCNKLCDKCVYHIFCCNMFVFACPIIAKSPCWVFALKYPYLPSYIRICPRIQLPAYAQWSQRLFVKVQRQMMHKDMHKIVFQSN